MSSHTDNDNEEGQIDYHSDLSSSESGDGGSEVASPEHKRQVLPVAAFDARFTAESVPETGEEYLALVQHERSHYPLLSVAGAMASQARNLGVPGEEPGAVTVVARAEADALLRDFDCQRGELAEDDHNCLKALDKAVKDGDLGEAYHLLVTLDTRLTANQQSLLRSAAARSNDHRLIVVVACRFGQSDLVNIE